LLKAITTLTVLHLFGVIVKSKMRKHNGVPRKRFYWYLKESEFRFNHRQDNLTDLIIKMLEENKIF
jgi:transposase-like protein